MKYDDLLCKKYERIRNLERAIARLHGNHDELEIKSRQLNIHVEIIPYDKTETDEKLKAKILTEHKKVDIVLTDHDISLLLN